jgi:hypothetical protein
MWNKTKKKRGNPESKVCVALWQWFQLQYPKYHARYLRFEVKQSSKIQQAILKAEGNKAGTSDILIALPSKEYGGLWLEVKADKGKLSENQKTFQEEMTPDYFCATGYGIDECIKIISQYMGSCGQ